MPTTYDRLEAMWLDYANFGGPADSTKAQPPEGRWSLAFCIIQHFGRFPWLAETPWQAAGGLGWDPCLPYPGTSGYALIEAIVLEAENVIGQMPDLKRLHGYMHGHRVPSGLNAHWSNPLDAIDQSGDQREGLVAKLKKATLEKIAALPFLPIE